MEQAKKQKSADEIAKQYQRIHELGDVLSQRYRGTINYMTNSLRVAKASEIASKYADNARSSRKYINAYVKARNKFIEDNPSLSFEYAVSEARRAGHLAAEQVKVGQRTYRGLSNG